MELKDLYFEYEKGKPIIKCMNLKIDKDEITAIVGPNGSGKTTLGKLMVGILRPSCGDVYILDNNLKDLSLDQVGSKVGYLFQNPEKHFFTNTVEEELTFVDRLKGLDETSIEKKIGDMLELLELEHLKDQSPLLLSQGEKQRLALGTIFVNNPEYLILDEPTSGLDLDRKKTLLNILMKYKAKGVGMTIISHDQFFIEELSQRVIEINRGEIVYDKRTENRP